MPPRSATLVVGLSGGADSVALLDALASLRRRRGFRVVAAHLDHGLREGSADDAAFCSELCQTLDVPLRVGRADVRARAARERGGLEQAARRERYAFLRRVREEEAAVALAVAHTRDDQAETLLLRLLRGAGATGLAGMRPRSADVVRPLLAVSRREVGTPRARPDLAEDRRTSTCRIAATACATSSFLPRGAFQPGTGGARRTASVLADEATHVRAEAEALLGAIAREEGGALLLRRVPLAGAPTAVARAAIRQALHRKGGLAGVGSLHVEGILRLARAKAPSGRRLSLPGGRQARFTRDDVRLERLTGGGPEAVSSPGEP
jgi:tRNA(Ile)-lysidine synthase